MIALNIIGVFASIGGLVLSFWVLHVAQGARRAAVEARNVARRKNLIEELEGSHRRIQQVGDLIQAREWIAVRIMATEILGSCRAMLTRWPDGLSEPRRNDLLNASRVVHSIADKVGGAAEVDPDAHQLLSRAQLKAMGLINDALGEAHRKEERTNN